MIKFRRAMITKKLLSLLGRDVCTADREGFSLAETLTALGIIGVLCVTMLSLNSMSDNKYKIAATKLSQVDSALKSWGKAISKSNETGLGAAAVIDSQKSLNDSLLNYFENLSNTSGKGLTTSKNDSYGSSSNEIILNNGVKLTLAYNDKGGMVSDKYSKEAGSSPLAVVTAETNDLPEVKEEYIVKPNGLFDLASIYDGYTEVKVETITTTDDNGNEITKDVYCANPKLCGNGTGGCANNPALCLDAPSVGTKSIFVEENGSETSSCGYNQTGAISTVKVADAYGVYTTTLNTCCPAPKVCKGSECGTENIANCGCDYTKFTPHAGYVEAENDKCERIAEKGMYAVSGKEILCGTGENDNKEKGYFCPNTGMTNPVICPKGSYCPDYSANTDENKNEKYHPSVFADKNNILAGGLINKIPCPAGHYCPDEGMTSAIECPKGTYCPNEGMTEPIKCPAGTYGDVAGKATKEEACKPCEAMYYCPNDGMTDDKAEDNPNSYKNFVCAASEGKFSAAGATACSACPAGQFLDQAELKCKPCAAGYYSDKAGVTACTACSEGYYQKDEGKTSCSVCPKNTYTDKEGTAECKPCEGNKISTDDRKSCVCPEDKPDWDEKSGQCVWAAARTCEDYQKYLDGKVNLIFISTPEQLASIGVDKNYPLNGNYCQIENIDLSELDYSIYGKNYNKNEGWKPIGSYPGYPFTGKYDGNNFEITNLSINRPYTPFQGLFSYSNGIIQNIAKLQGTINAYYYIGGLVGYSNNQTIKNVHADITMTVNHAYAGGLVGTQNAGLIENSSAKVDINGNYLTGGIAGDFGGTIDGCSASGKIDSTYANSYVGGIVGQVYSYSGVNNSQATGHTIKNTKSSVNIKNGGTYAGGIAGCAYYTTFENVENDGDVTGVHVVGGIVGNNLYGKGNGKASINGAVSKGDITVTYGNAYAGGIVGQQYYAGDIKDAHSTGNVITTGHYVGGLAGVTYQCNLKNVSAEGVVTGLSYTGGLAGYVNSGNVEQASAKGAVSGLDYVGGLIGYHYYGNLSDATADGDVSSTYWAALTGGLTGHSYMSNITNAHSTGNVTTKGYYTGGLTGIAQHSVIKDVSASGNVEGYYLTGGLIGHHVYGSLTNATSEGSVKSTGMANATGGLVGYSYNTPVLNAHHIGDVDAVGNYVGGLIGEAYNSSITDVSSKGNVYGYYITGGLIGLQNVGSVTNAKAEGNVTTYHPGVGQAGGLIGYNNYSPVKNASAKGNVSTFGYYAGGLIGLNSYSSLTDVSAETGSVSGTYHVGGLVGENTVSNITNANVTGSANVFADYYQDSYGYAGGLVGYDYYSTIINAHTTSQNVHALGYYSGGLIGLASGTKMENISTQANTTGAYHVGGLIGHASSASIIGATSGGKTVDSTSNNHSYVGGLVGYNYYTPITNAVTDADTVSGKRYYVGGAIGESTGSVITNISSHANVSGGYHVGGLIGEQSGGKLSYSYATGNVKAEDAYYCYAGGLIGYGYYPENHHVYSTGKVNAKSTHNVCYTGGLIGQLYGGSISSAFSAGDVTASSGKYYSFAGGFVGENHGTIKDAYSWDTTVVNSISPDKNNYTGGFAGRNYGKIWNAYSLSKAQNGGGFVGYHAGTLINTYWNTTLSNNLIANFVAGSIIGDNNSKGYRTENLKSTPHSELYVDWSTNEWCFGKKYPTLKNMPQGAPDATSCSANICPPGSSGNYPNCVCRSSFYYKTEIKKFYNNDTNTCQSCADIDPLYPKWDVELQRCVACPDGLHYNPVTNQCQECPYFGEVTVMRCTGEIGHVPTTCAGRDLSTYSSEYTGKVKEIYSNMSSATKKLSFEHAYIFDENSNPVAVAEGKPGGIQLVTGMKITKGDKLKDAFPKGSVKGVQLVNVVPNGNFNVASPSEAVFELENGKMCHYPVNTVYDKYFIIYTPGDPLILDFKDDGIKLTDAENGIEFDMEGNGKKVKVAWTKEMSEFDDAFLCLDKNNNGQIDNGKELFGDKAGSKLGFIELAEYDTNGDNVINKDDHVFESLLVWSDMNKNGVVDYTECSENCGNLHCNGTKCTRELKTMEEAGIEEISVDYTISYDEKGYLESDEHGNTVAQKSKFKMWVEETKQKVEEVYDELTEQIQRVVVNITEKVLKVKNIIDAFLRTAEVKETGQNAAITKDNIIIEE